MWIVAGCQAPPAAGTTQGTAAPIAQAQAKPPGGNNQEVDTRADSAAKLAASQAKSIEDMLAAKNASKGVTPADPAAPGNPPPPGTTALKSSGGDDVFKPVPPPPGGGSGAIASAVGFVSPPDAQPTPPPANANAHPNANPQAGVVMAQPPPVTPPPAAIDTPRPATSGTEPLETQLAKTARETPSDLAAQLDSQLYKFVKGESVPTPDALAGLNGEDREVLSAVLDGLSNFRTNVRRDSNLLIGQKIRPLTEMGDRLRSRADLVVTNAALCRTIRGWGNYEPISPLRLPAGVDNWPGLYYEIENFSSRLDANNMWATKMRQDVAIYDSDGKLVWQWPNEAVTDLCRNRRHDFFFARQVKSPIKLPAGRYILKISLTDAGAGRVAESSITLTMTPPAAVPPAPAGPPLR